MKESQFIKQSEKKWKNFEEDLKLDRKNPERTSKLFVQVTDDLAYARTHYPNRMVRKYLDGVSQVLLAQIYKNQRTPWSKFLKFWSVTLPLEVFRARRLFTISFIIFAAAVTLGIVSSIYEPEFARVILGDSYVEMTEANIEKGDPMAVYKEFNAMNGFASITMNNIRVAFITFVFGVLAAIGSVFVLVYNGIMVGAFQYFFIKEGLFWESFLTIWQHGTIEISAIIIAGAAGLTMGRGLIFTESYSRLQAFKISGQRGLTIFLGTIPLFIIAGFIESFLTRDTGAHPAIRLAVILVSLLFILFYFGWYPRLVASKHRDEIHDAIPAETGIELGFDLETIYSIPDLVRMSFTSLFKYPAILFISLVSCAILGVITVKELDFLATEDLQFDRLDATFFSWLQVEGGKFYLILSGFVLLSSIMVSRRITTVGILQSLSIYKLILAGLFFLPFFHKSFWALLILGYPVFSFLAMNSRGFKLTFSGQTLQNSLGSMYASYLFLGGLCASLTVFIWIVNAQVLRSVYYLLFDNYLTSEFIADCVFYGASLIVLLVTHVLCTACYYFLKHSRHEMLTADALMTRIKKLA